MERLQDAGSEPTRLGWGLGSGQNSCLYPTSWAGSPMDLPMLHHSLPHSAFPLSRPTSFHPPQAHVPASRHYSTAGPDSGRPAHICVLPFLTPRLVQTHYSTYSEAHTSNLCWPRHPLESALECKFTSLKSYPKTI